MTVVKLGTVNGGEFARAVKQVAVAAHQKGGWPPLDGVYLEIGPGAVTLAASDQYRLATLDVALNSEAEITPAYVWVQAAALVNATKQFAKSGVVDIALDDETSGGEPALVLVDSAYQAVVKQMEGVFPPYWRKLFPEDVESTVTVQTRPLVYAVREVTKVAMQHQATVHLELRNGLLEASVCGLADSAFNALTLAETGVNIGGDFNPKYIRDGVMALRGRRAEVTFYRRPDGNSPVCLSCDGYRYLVMPKRPTPPAPVESEEIDDEH